MTAALIVAAYVSFVVFGLALVLFGRSLRHNFARFGDLLSNIMQHRITRIAVFVVWWWLGWHFLVGTPEF